MRTPQPHEPARDLLLTVSACETTLTSAGQRLLGKVHDNGGVIDPLSYDSYSATEITGIAGVRLKGSLSDQLTYRLSLGVEHDFSYNVDAFKFSGNFGSVSYDTGDAPADWRLAGSAGISYLFAPDKEFNLDGYVSQFDKNAPAYTVMVGFKMGY